MKPHDPAPNPADEPLAPRPGAVDQTQNPAPALSDHAQAAIDIEANDRSTDAAADEAPVAFEDLVSGRFDAEAERPAAPPKRVLLPQPEQPKLHKVLAQAGLGSRMEMEQLIVQGRISVNGQPAHVGQRIVFGDQIKINGKPIPVRIAPHKTFCAAIHKAAAR